MNKKKEKLAIIIAVTVVAAVFTYFFFKSNMYSSVKYIFSSPQVFKKFIEGQGDFAPLLFFIIQMAQVIISPIPGNLTSLAAGALFGGVKACLLSGLAITAGSVTAFYLARVFGKPIVVKLIGESTFNKYNGVFLNKGKITLFILFLLPFFPDDALCFLAGLSKLHIRLFLIYTVVGRLPGIIFSSFTGAGTVNLPIGGWVLVGILSMSAIYISIRFGKNIEEWLCSKINFGKGMV